MPEAAALPAAGPPPPVTAPRSPVDLRDFPDRLSPMLVKELRQGLRSQLFLWAFLGMHVLLTLITLATLEGASRAGGRWFWWSIVMAIVIVMPLRGFNALIDEIRLNTMDTLVLTRLTAWRITFGKWCAIAAQQALVGITILPYLILRYFGGSVDLGREIIWLTVYLVLGWLFAAFAIGFSWMKYFLLRGLVNLAFTTVVVYFCVFTIAEVVIRRGFSYQFILGRYETEFFFTYFIASAYLIYFLLDSAASQVAPLAENRSSLRRIVTLGLAFAISLLTFADYAELAGWLLAFLAVIAGVDAMTEHPKHVSVISHPFVRRGFIGKLSGKILYPGWHSGVLFFFVLAALAIGSFVYHLYSEWLPARSAYGISMSRHEREIHEYFVPIFLVLGILLCAFLILRFLFRRSSLPLATYLGILVVLGILHALVGALADAINSPGLNFILFFSPVSMVIYWFQMSHRNASLEALSLALGAYAVVYVLISVMLAAREFKKTHACERQAERDLQHDPPPPEQPSEFTPLA